jgi:hypothetical protein
MFTQKMTNDKVLRANILFFFVKCIFCKFFINSKLNLISYRLIVFYSFHLTTTEVAVSFSFFYSLLVCRLFFTIHKVQASVVISCRVTDCMAFCDFSFAFLSNYFLSSGICVCVYVWKHRQKSLCMCTSGCAEKIDFRRRPSLC